MRKDFPEPESILEGPFWPEQVKVLSSRAIGVNLEIRAIGMKSERFYSRILTESDLTKVKQMEIRRKDFSGDAEAFFLAMEANRIRYAFQFDPLFAVNISQIDPLPHQIDAHSSKGISRNTLDLRVKETLKQIGAKTVEEKEE